MSSKRKKRFQQRENCQKCHTGPNKNRREDIGYSYSDGSKKNINWNKLKSDGRERK